MKAIIITIGDEILMGQILDTNSQYIARSLTDMGVEITEILSIPDKRDEIYETVEYAMSEADLIIVTGGLGPTKDDVTKKVLAEYFGSQLKMNEEVFARLEEMLKRRGLTMNEGNRSQALLPDNCRILRNDKGTASGMWFEKGWKSLISLPGVPFEMEHLIDTSVIEKEVSAFTIGIPDAESIRCPRIPIGTNAGKLGRCLKRGIEIGLSSFSGTGEITYYGERGKCKTPG